MALQKANQPFHYTDADGVEHFVEKNSVFDSSDPVTQGRDALFSAFEPKTSPQRKSASQQ